jgi:hypothetical protein
VSSKQTANNAAQILVKSNKGFRYISKKEHKVLHVVFARNNKVLYGQAYDLIKCKRKIDFENEKEVFSNLKYITIYEIKSTNRKNMSKDFKRYFFDLTTAELLVAQSLGKQFKFAFVNTITKQFIELSIDEVFAKSKKIYPKMAIRF